jgi:ribosomal protein S18 acetylase RimI-like enzyme
MQPDIRIAGRNDISAVEAVINAAYSHYVVRIGRKPAPMLDDYAALIREEKVHVIEYEGAIRGVLVLIPETEALLLDNVAIAPAAQGLGLGRKLLEFAERAAKEAGYRSIRLYTNEAMTEYIALYARIGYRETHRSEEKGLRRVYMTKPLS